MPAAAWPGTVHRYLSLPAFNVTLRVVDLPGLTFFDVFPLILKSCSSLPLFVIVNVTAPFVTDFLDSVKWNSLGFPAVTLTDVALAAVWPVPTASAVSGTASARPATTAATAIHLVLMSPPGSNCVRGKRPAPAGRPTRILTMPGRLPVAAEDRSVPARRLETCRVARIHPPRRASA